MRTDGGLEELDLHGMTVIQAKTAIDARLKRLSASVYRLRLIHGYHSGNALKDMIRKEYKNHKKVVRIEFGMNPGETDLVLRELY